MDLLVLGGSGFLGRHVVAGALERGWDVTTFNRGSAAERADDAADPSAAAGGAPAGGGGPGTLHTVRGDRTRPADLAPLTEHRWDAVIDTWSAAPSAVRDAAHALEPVAGRYVYVSSGSVYADLRTGPDEATATVAADPDAGQTAYGADKRGAELAAARAFGPERALLARAGLILGPGEDVGRLPWWLTRLADGGPTLAPGPPDLGVQFVDVRDLAAFLLDVAPDGPGGAVNVVAPPGEATIGALLEAAVGVTGDRARLVWAAPEQLADTGVEPWTDLPLWIPAGHEARGMLQMDVGRAVAAGLRTRPAVETVADTWAWLRASGGTAPQRSDRPSPGLDRARERAILASLGHR